MRTPRSYHKASVKKQLTWSNQLKQTTLYLEKGNNIYMFVETIDQSSNSITRCIHHFIDKVLINTIDTNKEDGNSKYKQLRSQGFNKVEIKHSDLMFF